MVDSVHAWRPEVPQVDEVLHATFEEHAYPLHTHDTWTVLMIDEGAVAYEVGRAKHLALPSAVTILPPHVAHDGRSARRDKAFRKRVIYMRHDWLPDALVGATADDPTVTHRDVAATVRGIHVALGQPGDPMAAEQGLFTLAEDLRARFGASEEELPDAPLARRTRTMLDDRLTETVTIAEIAAALGAHPSHVIRAFTRAYGLPPHRYVIGRRIDSARHLLVAGAAPSDVAVQVGFYDQAHLTRHFRKVLGVTPAAFAA